MRGTPGAETIPELKPEPKDIVLEKRTYSAFYETGLDDTCATSWRDSWAPSKDSGYLSGHVQDGQLGPVLVVVELRRVHHVHLDGPARREEGDGEGGVGGLTSSWLAASLSFWRSGTVR